jgi:hypothetical protein
MVVQRIVDRAKEHDIQPEVLADVVDSAYSGKTLDDLTKDELVQLGTDIAAGKYDLPFDKPEQATEAARGTGAAPLKGNPAPVTQPAPVAPKPASADTLQEVLNLTGGTLVEPERTAPSPAADAIAERVEKARKRAVAT